MNVARFNTSSAFAAAVHSLRTTAASDGLNHQRLLGGGPHTSETGYVWRWAAYQRQRTNILVGRRHCGSRPGVQCTGRITHADGGASCCLSSRGWAQGRPVPLQGLAAAQQPLLRRRSEEGSHTRQDLRVIDRDSVQQRGTLESATVRATPLASHALSIVRARVSESDQTPSMYAMRMAAMSRAILGASDMRSIVEPSISALRRTTQARAHAESQDRATDARVHPRAMPRTTSPGPRP